jgi:hypothetical protein
MFQVYGPTAWWWECQELVRKLLLSAVVVLFPKGSPLQVTVGVCVCGWAHVLHGVYKPWGAGNVLSSLQHGSLFVTTFVFLMGLLFKVKGVSPSSPTYSVLSIVMVVMCCAFLVSRAMVVAVMVFRNARMQHRGVQARKSWRSTRQLTERNVAARPSASSHLHADSNDSVSGLGGASSGRCNINCNSSGGSGADSRHGGGVVDPDNYTSLVMVMNPLGTPSKPKRSGRGGRGDSTRRSVPPPPPSDPSPGSVMCASSPRTFSLRVGVVLSAEPFPSCMRLSA